MIGDEESGGRECARIARPLSHQLLNLHPFSGRGGAKRRSAVGRWTGVVFRCLRSRGFERAEGFTDHISPGKVLGTPRVYPSGIIG